MPRLLSALAAFCLCAVAASAFAEEKPDPRPEARECMTRLASEDAEVRRKAAERIVALGALAIDEVARGGASLDASAWDSFATACAEKKDRRRAVSLVAPDGARLPLEVLRGARVALQAGIGNPAAFEGAVADAGGDVVARRFLRDHHRPTATEAEDLRRFAAGADLVVVTRKDLVKLRPLRGLPESLRALDVATEVDDGDRLVARILALRRQPRASTRRR